MRDGLIVQSGKYNELLGSGTDFAALVAAHDSSMELVEQSAHAQGPSIGQSKPSEQAITNHGPANREDESAVVKPEKGSSKLIKEEERETGQVSWNVYKMYITEAWGWWGVVAVIGVSLAWQGSLMASDYWLAYAISDENVFRPSLFIEVYAIIAVASILLVAARSLVVVFLGLETAQIFFKQILNSLLHAPMSFFDTTPSGRILSRVILNPFTLTIVIDVKCIICRVWNVKGVFLTQISK